MVNTLNPGSRAASGQQKLCIAKDDIMTAIKKEKYNLSVLIF